MTLTLYPLPIEIGASLVLIVIVTCKRRSQIMMNQNDERLQPILRRHGLTQCPDCKTPITAANVGWNPAPDLKDVFPIVFVVCRVCQKRSKVFQVKAFAQSLDDAIEALKIA